MFKIGDLVRLNKGYSKWNSNEHFTGNEGVVIGFSEDSEYVRVKINNCDCAGLYSDPRACNGFLPKHLDPITNKIVTTNDKLCSCIIDIIMVLGCQCGGK